MATTKVYYVGECAPRPSIWNRFSNHIKQWWQETLGETTVAQLLCCVDASEYGMYQRDCEIREDIRAAMRMQMGYAGGVTNVEDALHMSQRDGYPMTTVLKTIKSVTPVAVPDEVPVEPIVAQPPKVNTKSQPTPEKPKSSKRGGKREWRRKDRCDSESVTANGVEKEESGVADAKPTPPVVTSVAGSEPEPTVDMFIDNRARIVPKFAAAVVLHLKAKFGALSMDDANVMLIQRDYLKVCREHKVRDVDIASHRQHVLNAYFTEGVLEELALTRTRAPRWMRLLERKSGPSKPVVC